MKLKWNSIADPESGAVFGHFAEDAEGNEYFTNVARISYGCFHVNGFSATGPTPVIARDRAKMFETAATTLAPWPQTERNNQCTT